MSKKVVFGSGAAGDYSQVLVTTSRKKSQKKFQRITDLRLSQVMSSGTEGYRRELDQEKIGNGIFCGVGILAGTYTKRVGSKSTLRLIAAPTIYGQVVFEETGEAEVTEWVVNYDIATALIGRNADEEEEAYVTWAPKPEPVLMRASLSARLGQEKPHETQAPQPRADHPQAENC